MKLKLGELAGNVAKIVEYGVYMNIICRGVYIWYVKYCAMVKGDKSAFEKMTHMVPVETASMAISNMISASRNNAPSLNNIQYRQYKGN